MRIRVCNPVTVVAVTLCLVLASALAAASARAFHDGGVAYCAGCHTMHNSQNGAAVDAGHPNGNAFLLNTGNASDTCLRCHAAYGQFAAGAGFGAGGDFYWVTRTFAWGTAGLSRGDSHGHNVIAPTRGLAQDATLTRAPGGGFLSRHLGCTSCHDPHGNGNFRLLYGDGPGPKYDAARFGFTYPAPLARGNSHQTVTGTGRESNAAHTVYKSGMSDWCANCHPGFHEDHTASFVHPERALGSTVASTYNAYVSSAEQTGGDASTSYWGLVPFEAVAVDLAAVDATNWTRGPEPGDEVMCLTCHRAHASPFADAARWDMSVTAIVQSHPLATDPGAVQTDVDRKYYGYTFAPTQRSLCNKCHLKDRFDAPVGDPGIAPAPTPRTHPDPRLPYQLGDG